LRGALLAALLPLHLYQLTLHLLQLPSLSNKRMAAFTALLSLAGHCSEALRAYLDAGRLLRLPLAFAIKAPLVANQWMVKPSAIIHMIKDQQVALAWGDAQTATIALQPCRQALRWPKPDHRVNLWHVNASNP
jgi:hypothetical protein